MTTDETREAIFAKQRRIDQINSEIDYIARMNIPGFHFLNYKVSTFWKCETSAIGVCVFAWDEPGHRWGDCIYCHQPMTRK